MNKINSSNEVMLELKIPNLPNTMTKINGNLTLDEIEKRSKYGDYVLDRGMSIRNLNKTAKELSSNNSFLSFNLIKKSDKLIKDLEESEINFINIYCASCYQSCTLQGFVHVIFPLAIKNLNKERIKLGKNQVKDLDELKNDNIFNNTVIDILKEIVYIQGCGNGGKSKNGNIRYEARKLFEIAPPKILGGGAQGSNNIADIESDHKKAIENSKDYKEAKEARDNIINNFHVKFCENCKNQRAERHCNKCNKDCCLSCALDEHSAHKDKLIKLNNPVHAPPKKSGIEYKMFTGEDLVKVIEINKDTIVSEVVKFKVEGNNKYYGNLVLKFSDDNLNDPDLDIYKLINDCPQIKKNFYEKRKITETSDIIFMITDRLEYRNTIKKQFQIYENIFLDNNGYFNSSINGNSYTAFELKFIIFHSFSSEYSGHYTAYSKFRGKWHYFNDLNNDYAVIQEPPLINNTSVYYYPVCFYYVKNKEIKYNNNYNSKDLYFNNEIVNPYKILGIKEEDCKKMYSNNIIRFNGDLIYINYQKLKSSTNSNDKKKLLLSYYILLNINKFERIGNEYKVKTKDHFYYIIMGDLNNLQKLFEKNKYILTTKDNYLRNLLHYSVIGEYYEITKFLLEKGINFDEPDYFLSTPLKYATNSDIRKLLINNGSKIEVYNQSMLTLGLNINYNYLNKIDLIYHSFLKNKYINNIEYIKKGNDIIGKRLIRNRSYGDDTTSGWNKVYHGTKYVSMEHILIYGLKNFGEPLNGHIPLNQKVNDINNWANAIFVTPSIFYASNFSEIIQSDNEQWYIIIEAKVKNGYFSEYESTLYNYNYKKNEPKKIEYRINAKNYGRVFDCDGEEGIDTISLLFAKKKFIDECQNYSDGNYFQNK